MLSKAIKDKFVNTYYDSATKLYVTEVYDKWKRNSPKILAKSSNKDEAELNHQKIIDKLNETPLRKI